MFPFFKIFDMRWFFVGGWLIIWWGVKWFKEITKGSLIKLEMQSCHSFPYWEKIKKVKYCILSRRLLFWLSISITDNKWQKTTPSQEISSLMFIEQTNSFDWHSRQRLFPKWNIISWYHDLMISWFSEKLQAKSTKTKTHF